MEYKQYDNAADFLDVCKPVFLQRESVYGLMQGIALSLSDDPHRYGPHDPYLATVSSVDGIELIAMMTPPYPLQIAVLRSGVNEAIELIASHLHKEGWSVLAAKAEEDVVRYFAEYWSQLSGASLRDGMRMRIYELREVLPVSHPSGSFCKVDSENINLVGDWGTAFHNECIGDSAPLENNLAHLRELCREERLFLWADPSPVSMAALVRPTMNGIGISCVYTPLEARRKGYATALVAEISRVALSRGYKFCYLYADLDNPTSNSIYQKIGYNPVADVMDIHFVETDK